MTRKNISKIVFAVITFGTLIQISQAFQTNSQLSLPKIEDVQKIETKENKQNYRYYTPESLMRILPHLAAGNVKAKEFPEYQYGTITLKDNTILKWRSTSDKNLIIYDDQTEQTYLLDEFYIRETVLGSFWLKLFSAFLFIAGISAILIFYDYSVKYPESRPTRFHNQMNTHRIASVSIRILAASLIFYLGYSLLSESLRAVNDRVIRGTLGKGGGRYVFFADTSPRNFRFSCLRNRFRLSSRFSAGSASCWRDRK